jgi:hypothetical protein
MRTSSRFILAGIIIFVFYILDMIFFQFGVEYISIAGYVLFAILVIWILHGLTVGEKGKKLHRAEELLTHPFLMLCLFVLGIALIIVAIYYIFTGNAVILAIAVMIELGIVFVLYAYNNMKEGRKRGHW